ncbi:hypothetical protein A3K72_00410 [Candidatus Woesearchaeota archaeon RBG_13_36_6]|nr:MAG: hypothetical protein A3K72_00410 [Candidatus Woesearchaeota archaeon RBG_13_36_6]
MKILFYAINGVGLGHVNRTLAIAKEIRKLSPKTHIMFVTNSQFPDLIEKANFPYIKLPIFEGDPLTKDIKKTRFIPFNLNEKLIEATLYDYEPDAVVYDTHFPFGTVKKASEFNVKNILILRKLKNRVLDDYIKQFKHFDLIVLAHSEQEFLDMKVSKQLIKNIKNKGILFVGPIIRKPENIESNYNLNKFNILVTAGGGGWNDSKRFVETCIKACSKIVNKNKNINCYIITGPLYRRDINHIKNNNLIIKSFEPKLIDLMQKCDLVVSQAGYNVCNEIMLTKTPAIIISRKDPLEDQEERARWLEEKGVAIVINTLNEKALTETIEKFYQNKVLQTKMEKAFSNIKLDMGNERLSKMIIGLIPKKVKEEVKISRKKQELFDTKYKMFKKIEERLVLIFKEKGLWEAWRGLLKKERVLREKQGTIYSKQEPAYRELRVLRKEKEKIENDKKYVEKIKSFEREKKDITKQKEEVLEENKKAEKEIKKLEEERKSLPEKEPFKTHLKLQKEIDEKFEKSFEPFNIKIGEIMEKQKLVLEGKYAEKTWNALEKDKKKLEQEKNVIWLKELKPLEDKVNLSKAVVNRYKEEKGTKDSKDFDKEIESLWEDIKNNDKKLKVLDKGIEKIDQKINNLNKEALDKVDNKIKKIQNMVDERHNKHILPLDYRLDDMLKEKEDFLKKHKLFKQFNKLDKQKKSLNKKITELQD